MASWEDEKEKARRHEREANDRERYLGKFWHEIEDGNMAPFPDLPANWPVHYKENGERDYFREVAEYLAVKKEHDNE
jgi:hypothetical protein